MKELPRCFKCNKKVKKSCTNRECNKPSYFCQNNCSRNNSTAIEEHPDCESHIKQAQETEHQIERTAIQIERKKQLKTKRQKLNSYIDILCQLYERTGDILEYQNKCQQLEAAINEKRKGINISAYLVSYLTDQKVIQSLKKVSDRIEGQFDRILSVLQSLKIHQVLNPYKAHEKASLARDHFEADKLQIAEVFSKQAFQLYPFEHQNLLKFIQQKCKEYDLDYSRISNEYQNGECDTALKLIDQQITKGKFLFKNYFNKGAILLKLNNIPQAVSNLMKCYEIDQHKYFNCSVKSGVDDNLLDVLERYEQQCRKITHSSASEEEKNSARIRLQQIRKLRPSVMLL